MHCLRAYLLLLLYASLLAMASRIDVGMSQRGFILSEAGNRATPPPRRLATYSLCHDGKNAANGTKTTYSLSNPVQVKHWSLEEPYYQKHTSKGELLASHGGEETGENHRNSSSSSSREDIVDSAISVQITTTDGKHYHVKLVMQYGIEFIVENTTQKDLEKLHFCIGKEDFPGYTEYDEINFQPNGQSYPLWTLMGSEDFFLKEEREVKNAANGKRTTYTLKIAIQVKYAHRLEPSSHKDPIKEEETRENQSNFSSSSSWEKDFVFLMKIITTDGEHYDVDLVLESDERQFAVSKVTQQDLNQLTFCIRKEDCPDLTSPGFGHTKYDEIAFQKDGRDVSLWTLMACEGFFYKECT